MPLDEAYPKVGLIYRILDAHCKFTPPSIIAKLNESIAPGIPILLSTDKTIIPSKMILYSDREFFIVISTSQEIKMFFTTQEPPHWLTPMELLVVL